MALEIDFHSSIGENALEQDSAASLRENRVDPKLLYVTPRQTELWRKVFLKHSPIHGNPEFGRIYHEGYAHVAEMNAPGKVWLIGLGCGTGLKEADLFCQLMARGFEVQFSAVDVSRALVMESAMWLVASGAQLARCLVSDLAEVGFLAEWLMRAEAGIPRLFTFFGLVPNLAPSLVARLFRAILRPGDVLLVNAHLAPVDAGVDLEAAMHRVLPQYDNPETLAWLSEALEHWGLADRVEAPVMTIGEVEGVPAFIGCAHWKTQERKEPLQLFRSMRFTPQLFEEFLRREGFEFERLAVTACLEEAIWVVRK